MAACLNVSSTSDIQTAEARADAARFYRHGSAGRGASHRRETRRLSLDDPNAGKNPAAVALANLGGPKGGRARAGALTPKRWREIALEAARTRWERRRDQG